LGCKVNIQNQLFKKFKYAIEAEIAVAIKEGTFVEGINSMDLSERSIFSHTLKEFKLKDKRKVELNTICVRIGLHWQLCEETYRKTVTNGINKNGFYYPKEGKNVPYLAVQSLKDLNKYWMFSPLSHSESTELSEEELRTKFKKASQGMDRIKVDWENNYNGTDLQYVNVLCVRSFLFFY
jgi:hypothetical protein